MPDTSFISGQIQFINIHPLALKQQNLMMDELKSLPNYVKTDIYHNWDQDKNTVSWHYSFDLPGSETQWENTVRRVIEKHKQPS